MFRGNFTQSSPRPHESWQDNITNKCVPYKFVGILTFVSHSELINCDWSYISTKYPDEITFLCMYKLAYDRISAVVLKHICVQSNDVFSPCHNIIFFCRDMMPSSVDGKLFMSLICPIFNMLLCHCNRYLRSSSTSFVVLAHAFDI